MSPGLYGSRHISPRVVDGAAGGVGGGERKLKLDTRPGLARLARRSRGPLEATRATTIIIGFPRAERVFDEKLVPETRSCAPVVLAVVPRPLGSMKDKSTAAICVVQARMARRRGWYQV